jgi:hypothetical protein
MVIPTHRTLLLVIGIDEDFIFDAVFPLAVFVLLADDRPPAARLRAR